MVTNNSAVIYEFAIGSCGAIIAEVLHWHRIARRGKWPKYASSFLYWLITFLVVISGGIITAAVSHPGTSAIQLLLLGIVGPQLLHNAAQAQKVRPPNRDVYLGSEPKGLIDFFSP